MFHRRIGTETVLTGTEERRAPVREAVVAEPVDGKVAIQRHPPAIEGDQRRNAAAHRLPPGRRSYGSGGTGTEADQNHLSAAAVRAPSPPLPREPGAAPSAQTIADKLQNVRC